MELESEAFLRTAIFPEAIKDGIVRSKAFKPSSNDINEGLSLYINLPAIHSMDHVEGFVDWASRKIAPAKLGVCFLLRSMVEGLGLELNKDPSDFEDGDERTKVFEPQHHLLIQRSSDDLCPDPEKRSMLAKHATENGNLISAIR